jgi:hypothetical protein
VNFPDVITSKTDFSIQNMIPYHFYLQDILFCNVQNLWIIRNMREIYVNESTNPITVIPLSTKVGIALNALETEEGHVVCS